MIAELHNKISSRGSNLSDRLEDKLTGDFFGTIRYLPFEMALKPVLAAAQFQNEHTQQQWLTLLDDLSGYIPIRFWPRHAEGEIDLIFDLPEAVIGIEVKYLSALSSDDDELEEPPSSEESSNQLVRYSRMLADICQSRPAYLVFLAPFAVLHPVQLRMEKMSLASRVALGYLSWQHVLEQLQTLSKTQLGPGHVMMMEDLTDLLIRKGFKRFKGFDIHGRLNSGAYNFNPSVIHHRRIQWNVQPPLLEAHYVYNN